MKIHSPLFAAKRHDSQDQSGGRGPESPPAAAVPSAVAGGFIPLDSPDLKSGKLVTLRLEDGSELSAFRDPQFGWMDARGVCLPASAKPESWKHSDR